MSKDTDRIRALNDELRKHLLGGGAFITPGIAALGQEAVERLVKTIAIFDDFCHANDPHQEHDFGAFDADGVEQLPAEAFGCNTGANPLARRIDRIGDMAELAGDDAGKLGHLLSDQEIGLALLCHCAFRPMLFGIGLKT